MGAEEGGSEVRTEVRCRGVTEISLAVRTHQCRHASGTSVRHASDRLIYPFGNPRLQARVTSVSTLSEIQSNSPVGTGTAASASKGSDGRWKSHAPRAEIPWNRGLIRSMTRPG